MSKNIVLAIAMMFVVVSTTGCDQVNKLYESFSEKKDELVKKITKSSSQAQTATSVEPKQSMSAQKANPANVLVRVGSWTLTRDEFKERLKALQEVMPDFDMKNDDQRKLVLEELIRQELLVQEALRRGIDQDKDIKMAVEEFRRTLLVRQLATQMTENITATEEEAEEYYEENKNEFVFPGEWRLREIRVTSKDEAKEILIELLKGADFAEMAKQRSESTSAVEGGDLGFVSELPFPQMENAVMTLDAGGISSVIEGPDGFYIVKLEEKRGGETQDFESIKEDIVAGLTLLKQQQAILQILDDLQQKTDVEINESLL